jgi:hypothetical protein
MGALAFFVLVPALPARDEAKDKPKEQSAAEEYQAILKDYAAEEKAYSDAYRAAKTPEEQQKAFAKYPKADVYAGRFLAFAEKHPRAAETIDALIWVTNRVQFGAKFDKALAVLARDHLESEKIGQVCQRLVYFPRPGVEKMIRAVIAKNPHRPVQGQARYGLARFLKNEAQMVREFKKPDASKELVASWEQMLGPDFTKLLKEGDPDQITREAEQLLEQVAKEYGDVKQFGTTTLADAARGELFEMRNLVIGKVAPDIEGEDLDGQKFKLSDYRGKVVVLDFWGNW